MIRKDNGFDLNIQWRSPGSREYAFAFIALFIFLIVIYANSFQGTWQFDDQINIVENKNIFLKTFDWSDIKKTFYGTDGKKIDRPLAYFSFALNYYSDGLNVNGFHIVNFLIHYSSAVFLFLLIYNTLKLPLQRERYGPYSYSIALLATVFWVSSPLQVTAVTYIVQRMASLTGLLYIMAMYLYLKGRTTDKRCKAFLYLVLCAFSGVLALAAKENAIMIPVSIWLFDLLLIQGATHENIKKNLKLAAPVILAAMAIGLWYVDLTSILNGAAYKNRPFTLTERLLTEPRVIIFYITLLFYPISSRLTLIHDIEVSTSLISPWSTLPAIVLIVLLLALAGYLAKKRPLFSFCIFFFFLNHVLEGSFIPLELIYEHRNYIPSMFFFVPVVILMLKIIDYFSYKKAIQFLMVAVFTFLIVAQGHTVYARNALFANALLLWTDNVNKTPTLSRPLNNLGATYWDLGLYDKAFDAYSKSIIYNRQANLTNRGINLHNLGMYYLNVSREYDKALTLFESAIKVYPGYWPPYNDAAVCFIRQGNMAIAGKRIVDALLIWPNNADLRHTLSFILLKMGQYNEAIKQAHKALSYNPNLHNVFCVLGESYRKRGNYKAATLYWEQYIDNKPNDIEANLALMELYHLQNNRVDLSRTIGKLICLKGLKGWKDIIDQLKKDTNFIVYTPISEIIIPIVKGNMRHEL